VKRTKEKIEKRNTLLNTEEIQSLLMIVIQCFGAGSFAVSGAIVAMGKRMDGFGVIVMSILTVFGGGVIRDIIIGKNPPALFTDWDCKLYLIIAVVMAIVCMFLSDFRPTAKYLLRHSNGFVFNLADALGVSIFCVVGVNSAMNMGYTDAFLLTFVGGITGIGGGMLRDICAAEVPMVFRKHIYALPTIFGSLMYVYLLRIPYLPQICPMLITIAAITIVRILAAKYKWNLPVIYKDIYTMSESEEDKKE
jgi:uncharacterized membrane protein YeiH